MEVEEERFTFTKYITISKELSVHFHTEAPQFSVSLISILRWSEWASEEFNTHFCRHCTQLVSGHAKCTFESSVFKVYINSSGWQGPGCDICHPSAGCGWLRWSSWLGGGSPPPSRSLCMLRKEESLYPFLPDVHGRKILPEENRWWCSFKPRTSMSYSITWKPDEARIEETK